MHNIAPSCSASQFLSYESTSPRLAESHFPIFEQPADNLMISDTEISLLIAIIITLSITFISTHRSPLSHPFNIQARTCLPALRLLTLTITTCLMDTALAQFADNGYPWYTCGDRSCLEQNIRPEYGIETVWPTHLGYTSAETRHEFEITFKINGSAPCSTPRIDFSFISNDFDQDYEYLEVYEDTQVIQTCQGDGQNEQCDVISHCLTDHELSVTEFTKQQRIQITSSSINSWPCGFNGSYIDANLTLTCSAYTETSNTWLYILMGSIAFFSLLIAILAHNFNQGRIQRIRGFGCGTVDNARWVAVLAFGLHFWDFVSDINLVVEILSRDDLLTDMMIFVCGVGSAAFVFIPYVVNLYIATKIQSYIASNESAKIFFQRNSIFFGLLVAATGGCYTAVALLSSNIFGFTKFSSGLTRFEINQLSKIKVFASVILENVPQVLFQLVYVSSIDLITDAVAISFGASVLAIIATTLSYFVDRNDESSTVVHYYLSLQVKPGSREQRSTSTGSTAGAPTPGGPTPGGATPGGPPSVSPGPLGGITEEEKLSIHVNRGRRRALAEQLAAAYCIDSKRLEIGATTTNKYGSTTHIAHVVYQSDLDSMNQRFLQNHVLDFVNDKQIYTHKLYRSVKRDIEEAMRNHFLLSDEFAVAFSKVLMDDSMMEMPMFDRVISQSEVEAQRSDMDDAVDWGMGMNSSKSSMLKKDLLAVTYRRDSQQPLNAKEADEQTVVDVLKGFMEKHGKGWTQQQKEEKMREWIQMASSARSTGKQTKGAPVAVAAAAAVQVQKKKKQTRVCTDCGKEGASEMYEEQWYCKECYELY